MDYSRIDSDDKDLGEAKVLLLDLVRTSPVTVCDARNYLCKRTSLVVRLPDALRERIMHEAITSLVKEGKLAASGSSFINQTVLSFPVVA